MHHTETTRGSQRAMRKTIVGAMGLAAAILYAATVLVVTTEPADATPNKVTASKPCGSCHPPNKPPRRR